MTLDERIKQIDAEIHRTAPGPHRGDLIRQHRRLLRKKRQDSEKQKGEQND